MTEEVMSFEVAFGRVDSLLRKIAAGDEDVTELEKLEIELDRIGSILRDQKERENGKVASLIELTVGAIENILIRLSSQSSSESAGEVKSYEDAVLSALRVVCNAVADTEKNRDVLERFLTDGSSFSAQLKFWLVDEGNMKSSQRSAICNRIIIMLRNYSLDSPVRGSYIGFFFKPVLDYCLKAFRSDVDDGFDDVLMGLELLSGLKEKKGSDIQASDIDGLIGIVIKMLVVKHEELKSSDEELQDEAFEVLLTVLRLIEFISGSYHYDFKTCSSGTMVKKLFGILTKIEEFSSERNMLSYNRSLLGTIGGISANIENSNVEDRDLAISNLSSSSNPYIRSACMTILANSIRDNQSRDEVIDKTEKALGNPIVEVILSSGSTFKDPVLLQALFQILRHILTFENVFMVADEKNISLLVGYIEQCLFNMQYYPGLGQLMDSFMKKLITLAPRPVIQSLTENEKFQALIIKNSATGESFIEIKCLLINKMVIFSKIPTLNGETLIERPSFQMLLQEFVNAIATAEKLDSDPQHGLLIFEFTKTLGILVANEKVRQVLLKGNEEELYLFLRTLSSLSAEAKVEVVGLDKPSSLNSILANNVKFIAGSLFQSKSALTPRLSDLCTQLLSSNNAATA